MKQTKTIGIDLAKASFGVVIRDEHGHTTLKRLMSEQQLVKLLLNHAPAVVAMEACSTANYWARKVKTFGHNPMVIAPQHVKAYLIGQKNDLNDALAISEAARNPEIRQIRPKTIAQQDLQSLIRVRSSLIRDITALGNQMRGLLAEYGIKISAGKRALRQRVPLILEAVENNLSLPFRKLLHSQYERYIYLEEQAVLLKHDLARYGCENDHIKRLQSIPGYGPIVATCFYSVLLDGSHYRNGRGAAASLGLVPRQHSSGGKTVLGRISKQGDSYLRSLLVHGARSVMAQAHKKEDTLSRWACRLKAEKGYNKAVVALANKLARIGWAVLYRRESYRVVV